jgi:hypothetical protein
MEVTMLIGPKRVLEEGLTKRTKGDNNDVYDTITYYQQDIGDSVETIASFDRVSSANYWHLTGWNIPDFYAKKRRGDLLVQTPFYSFQQYGWTEGVKDVLNTTTNPDQMSWCYDHIYYDFWRPSEDDVAVYLSHATNKYVQEAAAAIMGSGHDTLTFLAELTEVRHMFLQTGKRLLKLSSWAPKGWKGMSSDWLSGRYGWRTLIYDLQDLNKAIRKLEASRTRYSETKGTKFSTKVFDSWEVDLGSPGTRHFQTTDSVTIGINGCVVADIEIPDYQFNLLLTGWEKIPFSFVIDWFVSIGKSLATIVFLGDQKRYTASYGISITHERSAEMQIEHGIGRSGSDWQNGYCWTQIQQRIPCDIPLLPHFRVNLSSAKILDLLGLVIQRR